MTKQILTVTIVLLTVTTHLSAQARDGRQTLEGLREIGLIVKYGQADGLDSAMQPTILQMLQDRAKDLLRAGGVPLIQSTNEADLVGKPRLVFTVTLKKRGDIPPALAIQTSLYQRVRLSRDPAKEMELVTWEGGTVGATVTHQNVFALFELNVNGFVTAYRAANPTPAESRPAEAPTKFRINALLLQGLNGVRLVVTLSFIQFYEGDRLVEVDPRFRDQAFSKMLQNEAETKFTQAGIPLLRGQTEGTGGPLLAVSVTLCQPDLLSPAIGVGSTFWQGVRLVRDPRINTLAVTWESRASEGWPITEKAILKVINRQLDEFIEAYTAANPRVSSLSN